MSVLRDMSTHLGGGTNALNTFTDGMSTIICESSIILCFQFITLPALCVKLATFKLKFMNRKSFSSLFIVCDITVFYIWGLELVFLQTCAWQFDWQVKLGLRNSGFCGNIDSAVKLFWVLLSTLSRERLRGA